jgi:hypothetical protein
MRGLQCCQFENGENIRFATLSIASFVLIAKRRLQRLL